MAFWKDFTRSLRRLLKSKKRKTADASTQTEVQPIAVAVKKQKPPADLLASLHRESMMMDFYARRGVSWPTREPLPWKVKLNNLYPDLSEFL